MAIDIPGPCELRLDNGKVIILGTPEDCRKAAAYLLACAEWVEKSPGFSPAVPNGDRKIYPEDLLGLLQAGLSVRQAASRLGITRARAYQIIKRMREKGRIPPTAYTNARAHPPSPSVGCRGD